MGPGRPPKVGGGREPRMAQKGLNVDSRWLGNRSAAQDGCPRGVEEALQRSVMPQALWAKQETPRLPESKDQQDHRESKHAGNVPAHTERMHLHAHTCT